jgi:hypothetical protein
MNHHADSLTCAFPEQGLPSPPPEAMQAIQRFLDRVSEEQFQRDYFQRAPAPALQRTLAQRLPTVDSTTGAEPH